MVRQVTRGYQDWKKEFSILLPQTALGEAHTIAERIREVLRFVEPERLWIAPSCGFGRRRTTDVAVGELSRMVEAAKRF